MCCSFSNYCHSSAWWYNVVQFKLVDGIETQLTKGTPTLVYLGGGGEQELKYEDIEF